MTFSYAFYSYKGGSGRTTTLLNTVKYLINDLGASPSKPILLVDADLESAGMTYYFECEKRFTDELNTNNMMKRYDDIFTPANAPYILNKTKPEKESLFRSAEGFNKALQLDSFDTGAGRFSDVIGNVKLTNRHARMLKNILADALRQQLSEKRVERYERKYKGTNGTIWDLTDEIVRIDKMAIDEPTKEMLKTKTVIEFLPCTKFLDVTEFFTTVDENGKSDLEPNTVLFLGTDVSSSERVPRDHAVTNIDKLIELCEKNGYAAVVFDSGSGTQSSATALHATSDVIVYCLRATIQFVRATRDNIANFYETLTNSRDKINKSPEKKSVIIFPTAVPERTAEGEVLGRESFDSIESFSRNYDELIDGWFCDESRCLHEVQLFKWREKILGCKEMHSSPGDELYDIMDKYSHSDLPEDVKKAAQVYKELSEHLKKNS